MPTPTNVALPRDELCRQVVRDPHVVRRSLSAGAKLLPDTDIQSFRVVLEGAVAVELHRPGGISVTLEVLGPGDCFPPTGDFATSADHVTFRAMTPTSVARVPATSFERVVRENPSLASALGRMLADQHAELLARAHDLTTRVPAFRISRVLLYLMGKLGAKCPFAPGTQILLAQSAIAQVADMSRQTTNRSLRELQASGFVHVERSLVCVLHRPELESVADGSDPKRVWRPAASCKFLHPGEPLSCYPLQRVRQRDVSGTAASAKGAGSGAAVRVDEDDPQPALERSARRTNQRRQPDQR